MNAMNRKILVVDDEPQIIKVLKGYLEKAGFRWSRQATVKWRFSCFNVKNPFCHP